MKAILVIDLNDTTLNEWDTDTSKCWAEIKVYTPIKSGAHGIGCVYADNNVELKPMPERKTPKSNESFPQSMTLIDRWRGFDECIDEILGEEE